MTTDSPSEKRLEELREQAWKEGVVAGKGVDVAGGPIPRKPGYYGQPVVKPPVWTWEIPIYFFMGGMAGMSSVIASGAIIFHHVGLARARRSSNLPKTIDSVGHTFAQAGTSPLFCRS